MFSPSLFCVLPHSARFRFLPATRHSSGWDQEAAAQSTTPKRQTNKKEAPSNRRAVQCGGIGACVKKDFELTSSVTNKVLGKQGFLKAPIVLLPLSLLLYFCFVCWVCLFFECLLLCRPSSSPSFPPLFLSLFLFSPFDTPPLLLFIFALITILTPLGRSAKWIRPKVLFSDAFE